MSETIEEKPGATEEISPDDLRRMLAESRSRVSDLERQRETERAGRLLAEQERDTASSRVTSEAEQRWAAQKTALDGSLAAAEAEAERAEQTYAAAAETGDWTAAAKAQRAIAAAEARATQFRSQREFLESNKERLINAPAPVPRSEPGDKYGAIVKDLKPAEREWLDQRPQFLDNPQYRSRVFGASQIADAEGNARGTEGYFRRIEELLGEAKRDDGGEREPPARIEPRRAASSDIAPQRRAAPNATPSSGREVRLTADQVEVADSLYGNPSAPDYIADQGERYRKYHANLERMRASGRL